MLAWLTEQGCTHVAIEATGVYWKPVWNILSDGAFELVVANAAHIKNVPGRKTGFNDAMSIADLVACGLLKASFVADRQFQELRSLLRTREQVTREQTRHIQRLQKTLEEANLKLDSVITDIMGLSGRRMIEAIIAGVTDPTRLALLADRRIKASQDELREALRGRVTDHHRFLLQLHLEQHDVLTAAITKIDQQVDMLIARLDEAVEAGQASFHALLILLCSIPGVSLLSARIILAEIGRDMRRFPTAGHLVAPAFAGAGSGPACVQVRTKAPANANHRVCAKTPPGSRQRSCNARSPPSKRRTVATKRGSIGSRAGEVRRRRSAPLPHQC